MLPSSKIMSGERTQCDGFGGVSEKLSGATIGDGGGFRDAVDAEGTGSGVDAKANTDSGFAANGCLVSTCCCCWRRGKWAILFHFNLN